MATPDTRSWISFFQDAGIQDHGLAARYAAIFVDNEIRSSMLKDLDMELLRVMGISKVGHVLGILKHAKHVHDTQLFADSQTFPTGGTSGTSNPVEIKNSSKPSVKKIRTTGLQGDPSPAVKSSRSKVTERLGSVAVNVGSHNQPSCAVKLTSTRHVDLGTMSRSVVKPTNTRLEPKVRVTDRLGAMSDAESAKRKMITFSSNEVPEEIPTVKKVRRVLPEHEGGYSIRLPTGSTPRSRQILAKMNVRQPGTVFDRLGEAAVSSTTEVDEPTITITGFGTQIIKSGPSVFSRLGGKSDPTPTICTPLQLPVQGVKSRLGQQVSFNRTTSTDPEPNFKKRFSSEVSTADSPFSNTIKSSVTKNAKQVQYVGVLKKPTTNIQSRLGNKPQVIKSPANSTTATKNSSAGILGNPTNALKLSAKERLDLSRASPKDGHQTKARKFIVTNKKTGVKTIVYKMVDDEEDIETHPGKLNSSTTAGPSFGRQGFSAY